jgi:hypothetical protein
VQLQQIILNLCANAAQAIDGSGSIYVTASQKEVVGPTPLSHGELEPGRYVRLVVSDSGRGFDEVVALRLFEPFFTTRSTGTGLGLATVREIVRDHDGALNVDGVILRGSRLAIVVKGGWARGFFDNDSRAPTLPGKHITDHQARLYMDFHRINATNVAAAKAGFSSSHRSPPRQ